MDDQPKILIVDDEKDLCEILKFNLAGEGYFIEVANSAEEALDKSPADFDLILLDVMMGGMSGYQLADKLRKEQNLTVPIIFLTARQSENDLLTGFNVGGDDYITKPFSIKEVIARTKAILRRGKSNESKHQMLTYGKMEIDLYRKAVSISGEYVTLTRKEFEILALLIHKKGKFMSREEILDSIWSDDVIVTERNVDVNIARLRKKIGAFGNFIKGRSGYGYCFEDKITAN